MNAGVRFFLACLIVLMLAAVASAQSPCANGVCLDGVCSDSVCARKGVISNSTLTLPVRAALQVRSRVSVRAHCGSGPVRGFVRNSVKRVGNLAVKGVRFGGCLRCR